ncbi:MAG TPA: hypothetical protein VGH38_29390, partial [Bryobacteraceae bacterium]
QTNRQVLTTFGQVFTVNRYAVAAGYSRPNGDGAGFDFVWKQGRMSTIGATPLAINTAGQIAGWRVSPTTFRPEVVLLQGSLTSS